MKEHKGRDWRVVFGWNMGYRPSGRKYMSGFLLGASWQKWGDHERNVYIYLGPWLLSFRVKVAA